MIRSRQAQRQARGRGPVLHATALGLGLLTTAQSGCSEAFWSRFSVEDPLSCYAGRACPSGYECSPATFLCYPEGTVPIPDGGSVDFASTSSPMYVLQPPTVLQAPYWNLRVGRFTDKSSSPQVVLSGDQSRVDFLSFGAGGSLDAAQTPDRRSLRNIPTSLELLAPSRSQDELLVTTVDSIYQLCRPGACGGTTLPDLIANPGGGEAGLKFAAVGAIDTDSYNDIAVVSSKIDLSPFGINAALGTGRGEILLQTSTGTFNRSLLTSREMVMAAVGQFSKESAVDSYTVAATLDGVAGVQLFTGGLGVNSRTTTAALPQAYELIAAADLTANYTLRT